MYGGYTFQVSYEFLMLLMYFLKTQNKRIIAGCYVIYPILRYKRKSHAHIDTREKI